MKEHPIIFSDSMVRAILDGRKTQTRRLIEPMPHGLSGDTGCWWPNRRHGLRYATVAHFRRGVVECCPYGVPGDRLWVRECWSLPPIYDSLKPIDPSLGQQAKATVRYLADGHKSGRVRASMHMPRWASRITLEITIVRVQRVREISEDDAEAEGCERDGGIAPASWAADAFRALWDSIYSVRGFGWGTNPWVWVIEFKRVV